VFLGASGPGKLTEGLSPLPAGDGRGIDCDTAFSRGKPPLLLSLPPLLRLPLSEPGLAVETDAVVEAADTERGEDPLRSRSREDDAGAGGGDRLDDAPALPLPLELFARPTALAISL